MRTPIRKVAVTTAHSSPTIQRPANVNDALDNHELRLVTIETAVSEFEIVNDLLRKIGRYLKWGLPMVATAAVTSGVVSGNWGEFIKALFS